MPELKSFALILMIFVLVWSFLLVFTWRILFLLLVRLFQCPASCENVTQIMTRYLHLITNSRSSWNSLGCVHDQPKQESYFCWQKIENIKWNVVLANSFCTVQIIVYRCFADRPWRFYSRFCFSLSQKLVRGRISKVLYLERTCCNKFCSWSLWQSFSRPNRCL